MRKYIREYDDLNTILRTSCSLIYLLLKLRHRAHEDTNFIKYSFKGQGNFGIMKASAITVSIKGSCNSVGWFPFCTSLMAQTIESYSSPPFIVVIGSLKFEWIQSKQFDN